jgi:tetratricopeptide (TPR) repeat protein
MSLLAILVLTVPATSAGFEDENPFRRCLALSGEPAIAACRQALSLDLSTEQRQIALRSLGQKLASLALWSEATEAFRLGDVLAPMDAQASRRHGDVLLYGVGRISEAIDVLRESLRLDDQQPAVHGSLGVALNMLGRHADSVRAFEDALEEDPTYFASRPAAMRVFQAAQRGESWPPAASMVDE